MSKHSTAVQSEAVNQSGEIHVKEGTAPSTDADVSEAVSFNEAIKRIEALMDSDPTKAKEAMRFLNKTMSEKHGVRGFARQHWGKIAIGTGITLVIAAGVIYWVRSRSEAAADAMTAALDLEASQAADAIAHEVIARSIV